MKKRYAVKFDGEGWKDRDLIEVYVEAPSAQAAVVAAKAMLEWWDLPAETIRVKAREDKDAIV